MFDKLVGVEERFVEIEKQLSDPKVVNDRKAYETFVREHADLGKIVTVYYFNDSPTGERYLAATIWEA